MTFTDWLLRDRTTGEVVIGQRPNTAIGVFVAATALRLSPYDRIDDQLRYVGAGALVVWGVDEALRGVNPLRRLMGVAVLSWQVLALTRR